MSKKPPETDRQAEIVQKLDAIVAKLRGPRASVARTAKALRTVGATVEDERLVIPLEGVNEVLKAASRDGVSLIVENIDLAGKRAFAALHGLSVAEANDMGAITSIDDLIHVNKPANSRCE